MKINENLKIYGKNVILIPYEQKHVEKYHQWMKDEKLRTLTASEPLTLDEEYEMQLSWRNDNDKCTFLILDKEQFGKSGNELESLIGDTNLFLQTDDNGLCTAETEIMIAEPAAQRRGFGRESMLLMLKYGQSTLKCQRFISKISYENQISLAMFKKLQFCEVSRSDVFQELTLERIVTPEWIDWLNETIINYQCFPYHGNC